MTISRNSNVPDEIYVQFVRALFASRRTLLIAAGCYSLVALMAYVQTQRPLFAIISLLIFCVGAWRFHCLRLSQQELDNLDIPTARKFEFDYILKGGLQGLLLGAFSFFSIYVYPDQFAELGALGVSLATLVAVVGRNYGSARMVLVFTATILGPLAAALLLRGEPTYMVLGFLMLPFGFIIVRSAAALRQIFIGAALDRKKVDELAQRFDRALNTMSHGLVMFDAEGRVVIANEQAAHFLGFSASEHLHGRTLKALLSRGVAGKLLSAKDFRYADKQLTRALKEGRGSKVLLHLRDGRHFEFSAREGKDELGVITFEEVTQRVEAEAQIRHMARFDGLTGLPNRIYFNEMITDLMATGDPDRLCGFAIMDLDDFKSVNDTLGHPVGDGLIYAVAERLSEFVDDNIKISRFGGDEFVVFFNRVESEEDFALRFNAIFEGLQGEVEVAGHSLRIQSSAGAVVVPAHKGNADVLAVKADLALYNAKEWGKNRWRLFEADMDAAFRDRQVMKAELRSAIQAGAMRVVYQPILDMQSMRMSGCEALCRWDHPKLGPIEPSVFIPLAEEIGLISEISSLVLETACRDCVGWPQHLGVSVNLSAKDFYNNDIVAKVQKTLERAGLAPDRLEIEVTETALLDDKISCKRDIEKLKALGVSIALDDFGTGYSSLSYLHTLSLDCVKIDGSFLYDVTRNKRSHKLLKGVVELSRNLGLSVTVEGVETFEQLKLLEESVKPDRIQGFLFGSPLSSTGIETMSAMSWSVDGQSEKRDVTVQH